MNKKSIGSALIIGAGVSVGLGVLAWALSTRKERAAFKAELEMNRDLFTHALKDMLNQKDKARSFWQGQAKEWIEEYLAIPFQERRLEEFRKALIYSFNQSEDDKTMSENTEKVITDILDALGGSSQKQSNNSLH